MPTCSGTFDCPLVFKSICLLGSERQRPTSVALEEAEYNFWHKLCCHKCLDVKISPVMIANQVKRQAERFVLMYYRGILVISTSLNILYY
ncbi:hypothetical protein JHK82_024330 [Glycine max]|uniref:Uncharacterized protein n=1 Tax=Glycine max TaxID=3847 RepID=K7LCD9_SOYBN|nr:hypothetical protein JHK87_024293 [Glycine soja]KAG5006371.1 hypothetical protein JHK85_024913 [Glycine max]KAG5012161.1 hypothetical protein JHK86_024422 [Glycine max]KAG5133142.1 hypothetical protein JHK82_024330 [Glycine max]KAH1042009.1 hypothetical protein GYH30_024362 [Glycine max]